MKEHISARQATYLALGVILGTVFLPIGQVICSASGRDGWMVVIPSLLAAFPFVYLVLYIYLKSPDQDILQQAKKLLGSWLGYPLIALYFVTCAAFTSLLIRQGGELFSRSLMIETPLWFFIIGITCLLIMIIYCGIEVFARFNEVTIIPIFLSLVVLILFSIPKAEISYLKPYLYNGLAPLLRGLPSVSPWGFEYLVFLWILIPYINKPHEIIRSSLRGYTLVSIILCALVITEMSVFSPEETTRLFYGAFSLARLAEVGQLFHGLEAFFILFWFAANIIKTSAFFFCTFYSLKALVPIKGNFLPISLLGVALGAASLVPVNSVDVVNYVDMIDKYMILPITGFGTTLLALICYVKGRRT